MSVCVSVYHLCGCVQCVSLCVCIYIYLYACVDIRVCMHYVSMCVCIRMCLYIIVCVVLDPNRRLVFTARTGTDLRIISRVGLQIASVSGP